MGQYDIGLSASESSTSGANQNSAFNVTGGGGSLSSTLGNHSPTSGTGTPSGSAAWLPWVMVGLVVVAMGMIFFLGGKK
jgi:hypothetical protein